MELAAALSFSVFRKYRMSLYSLLNCRMTRTAFIPEPDLTL